MSDVITILPANATQLERDLEAATARIGDVPYPVDTLWHPDKCPVAFLPWLAWALSVDLWKSDWPEARKRAVIKNSIAWHRRKGTVGAVRRAIAMLDMDMIEIVEWFQVEAQRDTYAVLHDRPYTFAVNAGLSSRGVSMEMWDELYSAIWEAKNVRSHLMQLRLYLMQHFIAPRIGAAAYFGEDTTIYPYQLQPMEQSEETYYGLAHYGAEVGYLYPKAS